MTTALILIVSAVIVGWFIFRPTKEQRIHNRFKSQIRKFTFKQYDGIVKICAFTCSEWGVERLPLKTVFEFVDKAQIISTDADPVTQEKVDAFNKTLSIFKNVLKMRSQETMNDGKISIHEIRHFVDRFKKEFVKAQEADIVPRKLKKNEQ